MKYYMLSFKFFVRFCLLFLFVIRLVSGAGDIKITKDGNVLLHEMVM